MAARAPLAQAPDLQRENQRLLARSIERAGRLIVDDAELGALAPRADAIAKIRAERTSVGSFAKACEVYAERPALGRRRRAADGHAVPSFETLTYAELWAKAEASASGLVRAGLARPGSFIAISGFGSPDWVAIDLACLYLAAVSVPLQTTMPPGDLAAVIREADIACIACSAEQVDRIAIALASCPSVRGVVVMDVDSSAAFASAKQALEEARPDVEVRALDEIEELGRGGAVLGPVDPKDRGEADPLMSLMYTSGSTGAPKGAMFPESLWRRHVQARSFGRNLLDVPYVGLCALPLNHAAGRFQVTASIVRGGLTCFAFASDMSSFFEDARVVRPTALFLVPRVAGMIHQEWKAAVAAGRDPDEVLRSMRRTTLGDRLLLLQTGSAPTPADVMSFLERCFEVPVFDAYGSTEAGPITHEEAIDREGVTSWKLVDVPDLGYRRTDRPFPRGELRVRTAYTVPGYYKNPEATAQLFDDEGYLITGDIVEQRGPEQLVWIDRAKNVLKLAQGEFVATSRIEGLLVSGSAFLRQVYLHAASTWSYALAVVVPDLAVATAHLAARGVTPTDAALRELCREEIARVRDKEQLRPYEVPRDFILERQPFTKENGLLTESEKPGRAKLRARYGPELEALHDRIEGAQTAALGELERLAANAPSDPAEREAWVRTRVEKALEAVLGSAGAQARDETFVAVGGDSIAAVRLSAALASAGVDLPVAVVLDPTLPLRVLASRARPTAARGEGSVVSTFERVHGRDAKVVRARDLRVDRFLDEEEIAAARRARPATELPDDARVVLLTGANGYLGRFLALELLARLPEHGRLYALVRAPTQEIARERVIQSFEAGGLRDEVRARAVGGRLQVLAGDFTARRLGLADEQYERLAAEVECVVHNGALVNHALSYDALFGPNVEGTAEVLRFAVAARRKALAYVSTVGALSGLDRAEPVREDEDIRDLLPERPVAGGYAAGYGTTKWASESLLHDATEALDLPVRVFRPSSIMASAHHRGQINAADFLVRLVVGIVYTGLAPRSFFAPGARTAFDGLPVEAVARSIAVVAVSGLRAVKTESFNVTSPHRDGASLDDIVDWIASARYRVERVDDHDAWFRTFRDRLTALAEPLRHRSPLAILDGWARPLRGSGAPDDALLLERLRALSRPGEDLADLPTIDERFVHAMLADMRAADLIGPPPA